MRKRITKLPGNVFLKLASAGANREKYTRKYYIVRLIFNKTGKVTWDIRYMKVRGRRKLTKDLIHELWYNARALSLVI